ncbi:NrfD/PsrC family molybdoenzyme membrane anchor subunit [Tropicimonas sp. IMCC6043]|uniref:NrfD/PsrC family molybdoenzyme membrane anchor subunit n=1 Tax=Tropicimonas sp. IMCC6043 TaxID=2510645 RepID=UPI00101D2AEC|nr:NrfD/PsrC family molybdoenzyme membrane anchor subunit [Tropicimonas sp. IMCC6043]RYH06795.1 tetrathionate reductase [Tropicimonas sp. IMCC6043]
MEITELVGAVHHAAWLPWAVQYFFLIAISTTALLLALPGFVMGRETALPRARLALMTAVTTGITAPIALLADLHQPGRFWEFFAYTNASSWMAWGAWFVPAYVGLLVAFAWAVHRPAFHAWGNEDWRFAKLFRWLSLGGSANGFARPLGIAATIAAILVLTYTGAEVYVVRSRPLWNTPFLPWQFLATGFVGALGVMLVLERVLTRSAGLEAELNRRLALWLAVVGALGAAWFVVAVSGISPRHSEALASVAGFPVWHTMATWGALTVAVTFLIATLAPARSGWATGLLAIHAAWMFRWTVFMGGQAVPKVGSGLYDAMLPTGIEGLMGVIGTFGLWLFLVIAYTTFIPWLEAGIPAGGKPAAPARPANQH